MTRRPSRGGVDRNNALGTYPPVVGSPLAWGRGSKQRQPHCTDAEREVAPRVGAWIETLGTATHCLEGKVAPRVGAWIETCLPFSYN